MIEDHSYVSLGTAPAPAPAAHKTTHQDGGSDEISAQGLSGVLADPQPPIIGSGAAQAVAGNDSQLTNARTPVAHTHPESDVTNLVADLAAKEATASKNAVSGYAGLNAVSRTTKGVDSTDDLIVDSTTKGLVLKDAITAHYFRITMSAGVLGLSDLGTTKP